MEACPEDEDSRRLPPGHVHSGIREFQQNVYNLFEHGILVQLPKKSRYISPTTARREAKAYADSIYDSWNTLQQILMRREAAVRRRWMKKSKEQRKQILLTAWPNMPSRHRPDFQRVFDPSAQKSPEDEDIFKWPHINLEDLQQAKPLLLLLNSRGRNPPHIFAHVDQNSFYLARQHEMISVKLVSLHSMLLAGQECADSYGKLVPLENKQQHDDFLTNHRVHFNPTAGLLVLEVQRKLLKFLVECCYLILRDIPRTSLVDPTLPELPEPEPLFTTETSYRQLPQVAAEAPYRSPSRINTRRIRLLIEARRSAAEDYVWDLREDPRIFASALLDHYTHCREYFPPAGDMKPSTVHRMGMNMMIWLVLSTGYSHLITWDVLCQKAKALDTMTGNDFDKFDRHRPLPKPVEETIIDMAIILEQLGWKLISILRSAVPASADPGVSFMDETDTPARKEGRHATPITASEDDLMRMFGLLCDNRHNVIRKVGIALVVDEIQRMLDRQPAQKKRMSSFVADLFSELALISHICDELMSIFPWAANFLELLRVSKTKGDNATRDAECVNTGFMINQLSSFVLPLSQKFRYPVDKAYNMSNVEALRRAEANLDTFWKEADSYLTDQNGVSLEDILRRNLQRPRELRRTPPWTPPEHPTAKVIKEQHSDPLEKGFSVLAIGTEKPGKFRAEIPRVKLKTRRQLSPLKDQNPSHPEKASNEHIQAEGPTPKFEVSARAAKVFRIMFHTYGGDETFQHDIDWKEFLHAMTFIGFAAEKLYGSVWHFTPHGPGIDKSIHLHEPHPSSKIPFLMARAFGRRFHRTYGWTGEMFSD